MGRKSDRIPIEPAENLPLIDCHCHFPLEKAPRGMPYSYDQQYQEFFDNNGQAIITSTDYYGYSFTKKFVQSHSNMHMTYGWGPQTVTFSSKAEHDRDFPKYLDFCVSHAEEFACIGEIGLDFHHALEYEKRERQIEIFEKIIHTTKHLNKPYSLHVRNAGPHDIDPKNPNDAYNESDRVNNIILEILEDEGIPSQKVMWHCFSGPADWGPFLAEKDYFISVPSSAYGFRKWRRNSEGVPITRLLTETDAAWQHPYKMGAFNTPLNVKYAVAAIAHTHQLEQLAVANQVLKNATQFFNLNSNKTDPKK
ncbi:MAG: TatD family hydrolase [Promethearchaeota archaeon]